jgi:hypothetical protein
MATATATVTISRTSSADAKSLVPLTATAIHDGNFRYSQDTTLQHYPTATGFGQPGQTHNVSEDNARHDSSSSESSVAITAHHLRPPSQPAALAPTANLGPCSRQTQMPPRPKPGRKPLPAEDAQDRRRVQNRMAQRNFRDKRAQKVSELTQDNENIRREYQEEVRKLSGKLQEQTDLSGKLMLENEKLKADLQAANKRADDAERKSQMVDHSNEVVKSLGFPHATLQNIGTSTSLPPMMANWNGPVADHAIASQGVIPTPPEDGQNNDWAENETDLTNFFSGRKADDATQSNDNDTQWLSPDMDVDREKADCGFCTDEDNCACIQSQKSQAQPQAQPQSQSQSQPIIAPGGCDACVRDPARAAACKALADQTEFSSQRPTQTATNNSNIDQRNDSMALPPSMMSCSTAIDRLGPRVPSIAELFPGKFHSYPSGTSGSGFDVAEQEVAQVLHNMSRRNTATGSNF